MAPTKRPTKRKAVAPLTEQAKLILRTARRQLAAEQTQIAERLRNETLNKMRANYKPLNHQSDDSYYFRRTYMDPQEVAFQKYVIPRTTAVLSSEGIRASVNVKMNAATTSAWTDYENINVTMVKGIDADPINAAAILRGLLYHEAGHISYTVPLSVLVNRCNTAGINPRLSSFDVRKFQRSWNIAEDQRMEAQVVDASPNKAKYFLPMVLDVVLGQERKLQALKDRRAAGEEVTDEEIAKAERFKASAYPFVMWRRYMPKALRRQMRDLYVAEHGLQATRAIEKALTSYMRASTPIAMFEAVKAFDACFTDELAEMMKSLVDNHGAMDSYKGLPDERRNEAEAPTPDISDEEVIDQLDEDEEDEDEEDEVEEDEDIAPEDNSWVPRSDTDHSIDGEEEEEEEQEEAPSSDAGEGGGENGASGTGDSDSDDAPSKDQDNEDVERDDTAHTDDDWAEELERALNEAIEERNGEAIVNEDGRTYNAAMASDQGGSKLVPVHSTSETNPSIIATGMTLAEQLEEAFHAATTEASPMWREQQTRGTINVGRYLTRQPGDREFFRSYDGMEGEQPGFNLSVSVLLDRSGSMGGTEAELAAVSYAMKSACDKLDIPCTVVLWESGARLLFDGLIPADHVPVFEVTGGTDPRMALSDIHNHRYDRETHIVLVMTDGQFGSADGFLNDWRSEGTYFIGAYYNHGQNPSQSELRQMSSKGFDITHGVTALSDLVNIMEAALCESVKVPS